MRKAYSYWNEEEIEYLKNNYGILDIKDLENNLDRTEAGIRKKASKFNLTGKSVNENFFKIWTPEMAYIFGFWIADGNMFEKCNKISFVSKDYNLLNIVKYKLDSDYKISNHANNFQLQIYNKIFYDDLFKLGGIPAKSLTIQFPEVPNEYLSHFIRGYFDGDGCFYIKKINNKKKKHEYLASDFVGNIDFLSDLKNKIKENANIDATGLYHNIKNNPRIYELQYFNKKAIALGDYIYQGSENLRLERKYIIYKKIKNNFLNEKNDW